MTTVKTSVHRDTGTGTLWIESHGKFDVQYRTKTEQKTVKHPVAGVAATPPTMTGSVTSLDGSPLKVPATVTFPTNGILVTQGHQRLKIALEEDGAFRVTAISFDT